MILSGDDINKASFLKPTEEEHGTFPTLEEAVLLSKEPKATAIPEHPEISEPPEASEQIDTQSTGSTKQTDALSPSPPPSPAPQPNCHPSKRAKKAQRETLGLNPNQAGEWVHSYMQKNERVPKWWREFWSLLCSKDECFGNVQVKGMTHWQVAAFWVPPAHMAGGPLCLAWVCLGKKTTSPKMSSRDWMSPTSNYTAPKPLDKL